MVLRLHDFRMLADRVSAVTAQNASEVLVQSATRDAPLLARVALAMADVVDEACVDPAPSLALRRALDALDAALEEVA